MNESKTGRFVLFSVAALFFVLIAGNVFLHKRLSRPPTAGMSSPESGAAVAVHATVQDTSFPSENDAAQRDNHRAQESRALDGEGETLEQEGPLNDVILIQ